VACAVSGSHAGGRGAIYWLGGGGLGFGIEAGGLGVGAGGGGPGGTTKTLFLPKIEGLLHHGSPIYLTAQTPVACSRFVLPGRKRLLVPR